MVLVDVVADAVLDRLQAAEDLPGLLLLHERGHLEYGSEVVARQLELLVDAEVPRLQQSLRGSLAQSLSVDVDRHHFLLDNKVDYFEQVAVINCPDFVQHQPIYPLFILLFLDPCVFDHPFFVYAQTSGNQKQAELFYCLMQLALLFLVLLPFCNSYKNI